MWVAVSTLSNAVGDWNGDEQKGDENLESPSSPCMVPEIGTV